MSRRRRCIVVHPSDEMYGADRVLLEVLRTCPSDVEVEVWLPTDVDYPERQLSRALQDAGIPVRRLALPIMRRAYLRPARLPGLAWRTVITSARLLAARPSLVYLNTAAAALAAPGARLSGARVVLHLHEHIDERSRAVLPFLRLADRIIAVSSAVADVLPAALRGRTHVVNNGFDSAPATPLPSFEGGIRVVIASRWNAWKGHRVLLTAWNATARTDLRLTILGDRPPSGEAVDVPALVAESPRADTITVVGPTSDVRAHLDAAHVVVVPSIQPDPLPTIAIETLGAGRALLASDGGGLREIAGDSQLLVAPGDVRAWTDALDGLDEHALRRAASTARDRFDRLFSRDTFDRRIGEELWNGASRS
ncbi:glycosyltransferase family 4 protein [Microbacterium trichothecenolyticum]|uniref:Glycosyltransferase involved in cell wall biosynthesis n=1 Tax=Microbacterium trichothecenolyticum TaxID=69370 RepID=A0ABU0TUL5_MICTR|nr:glycosyltransferase family 4 protein [Microbacterium trichothecenolyticum]MDQ1123348.1 glycosyltransferase involved in cell wall biosynthesis [Microbacterium trichothecenolyticum]